MDLTQNPEGACKEPGCPSWVFGEDLALGQGWQKVGDELFCPDHWPLAALNERNRVLQQHREARSAQIARNIHTDEAKKSLTTADYANWHEFQQEIVNFHRKHGKLAPAELRGLSPKDWLQRYQNQGPIDVEKVAQTIFEVEKAREIRLPQRLRFLME